MLQDDDDDLDDGVDADPAAWGIPGVAIHQPLQALPTSMQWGRRSERSRLTGALSQELARRVNRNIAAHRPEIILHEGSSGSSEYDIGSSDDESDEDSDTHSQRENSSGSPDMTGLPAMASSVAGSETESEESSDEEPAVRPVPAVPAGDTDGTRAGASPNGVSNAARRGTALRRSRSGDSLLADMPRAQRRRYNRMPRPLTQ